MNSYSPSGRPAYLRVADRLRRALLDGQWAPGEQLPSANDLAERWSTTRTTVQTAIEMLRREGLVYTRQGRGAFVRERVPLRRIDLTHGERGATLPVVDPAIEEGLRDPVFRRIGVGPEEASADVAARLGIAQGDRVLARRFLMLDEDETPLELLASFFVHDFASATRLADPEPTDTYRDLREEFGIRLGSIVQDIRARVPTPDEAHHLDLGEGDAVLHILRTAYAADGSPVNVLDAVLPGNRHVIRDRITLSTDDPEE